LILAFLGISWEPIGQLGTAVLFVPAPLVKRPQKVLNGLVFRPEIAQQVGRIRRESGALFSNQFLNGRMAGTRVPFSYSLAFVSLLHDQSTPSSV